jgi:hypothetical protein
VWSPLLPANWQKLSHTWVRVPVHMGGLRVHVNDWCAESVDLPALMNEVHWHTSTIFSTFDDVVGDMIGVAISHAAAKVSCCQQQPVTRLVVLYLITRSQAVVEAAAAASDGAGEGEMDSRSAAYIMHVCVTQSGKMATTPIMTMTRLGVTKIRTLVHHYPPRFVHSTTRATAPIRLDLQ